MTVGFDVSIDNVIVSSNLIHGTDNMTALRVIEDIFPFCSATDLLAIVFRAWFRNMSYSADFEDDIYDTLSVYCPENDLIILIADVYELVYGILDSIEQKILGSIGCLYPTDDPEYLSALNLSSVYVDNHTVMFSILVPLEYR